MKGPCSRAIKIDGGPLVPTTFGRCCAPGEYYGYKGLSICLCDDHAKEMKDALDKQGRQQQDEKSEKSEGQAAVERDR